MLPRRDAHRLLAETRGCSRIALLVEPCLHLELNLPDAVRLIPVDLCSADTAAGPLHVSDALQLSPTGRSAAILLDKPPNLANSAALRDQLYLGDVAEKSTTTLNRDVPCG